MNTEKLKSIPDSYFLDHLAIFGTGDSSFAEEFYNRYKDVIDSIVRDNPSFLRGNSITELSFDYVELHQGTVTLCLEKDLRCDFDNFYITFSVEEIDNPIQESPRRIAARKRLAAYREKKDFIESINFQIEQCNNQIRRWLDGINDKNIMIEKLRSQLQQIQK